MTEAMAEAAARRAMRFMARLEVACPAGRDWTAEFVRREARAQDGPDTESVCYAAALHALAGLIERDRAGERSRMATIVPLFGSRGVPA